MKGQASLEIIITFSVVVMITLVVLTKWLGGTDEINYTVGSRLAVIKTNDLNFDSNKFILKGFEKQILFCTPTGSTRKMKVLATFDPDPRGTAFEDAFQEQIKIKMNALTGIPKGDIDVYVNNPIEAYADRDNTSGCLTQYNTPITAITSPANGATFPHPSDITINATASDVDGTITKVEFYYGTTKIGEDSISPYSYFWEDVTSGTYELSTVAYDNEGLTGASSVKTISVVDTIPVVTIWPNSPGRYNIDLLSGGKLYISATASDPDSQGIKDVKFYVDGALICTDSSDPYNCNWPATIGTHTIKAVATDNANNSAEISQGGIVIYSMTCTYNGTTDKVGRTTFTPNGESDWSWTINLELSSPAKIDRIEMASENVMGGDGALHSTNSGIPIGVSNGSGGLTDTSYASPLSVTYPAGPTSITMYTNIRPEATRISAPIGIVFTNGDSGICDTDDGGMPSVNIETPSAGPLSGTNINLRVRTWDDGANPANIKLFENGNLLREVNNPGITFMDYTWNNPPSGNYAFTAQVTDLSGNSRTSAPVNVNFTNTG